MWHLTYKGKTLGKPYQHREDVIRAYIRMFPVMIGIRWEFKSQRRGMAR